MAAAVSTRIYPASNCCNVPRWPVNCLSQPVSMFWNATITAAVFLFISARGAKYRMAPPVTTQTSPTAAMVPQVLPTDTFICAHTDIQAQRFTIVHMTGGMEGRMRRGNNGEWDQVDRETGTTSNSGRGRFRSPRTPWVEGAPGLLAILVVLLYLSVSVARSPSLWHRALLGLVPTSPHWQEAGYPQSDKCSRFSTPRHNTRGPAAFGQPLSTMAITAISTIDATYLSHPASPARSTHSCRHH